MRWLSYRSPIGIIWFWHGMFDGTWLCRCAHSERYKRALKEANANDR